MAKEKSISYYRMRLLFKPQLVLCACHVTLVLIYSIRREYFVNTVARNEEKKRRYIKNTV